MIIRIFGAFFSSYFSFCFYLLPWISLNLVVSTENRRALAGGLEKKAKSFKKSGATNFGLRLLTLCEKNTGEKNIFDLKYVIIVTQV